jgi:O-antigen/teichoic acid export membrane protein
LIFRDLLVPLFYDAAFAPAASLLRLLVIGKLFEVVNIVFLNSFVGRARMWSMLGLETLRSVLLVLGTWTMLPRWGLAGAALGHTASHLVMTGLGAILLREKLHFPVSGANIRLLGKATLLIVVVAAMSYNAWYQYALAIVVSMLVMRLLVGWDRYRAILALYLGRK